MSLAQADGLVAISEQSEVNAVTRLKTDINIRISEDGMSPNVRGGINYLVPSHESFKDLVNIEKKRRHLLSLSNKSWYKLVFSWTNTCLQYVVLDPQLWLSIAIYAVVRFVELDATAQYAPGYVFAPLPITPVTTVGGIVSFLIVFYVSQCYVRFMAQYDISVAIPGEILKASIQGRVSLTVPARWRLWRYMNAIHILGYVAISEVYNADNFFIPLNQKWKLLSPTEIERLQMIGVENSQACVREVTAWCIELIKNQKLLGAITEKEMGDLMGYVFNLRASISRLFQFADQPIPFAYTHFLHFMTLVYLPLFAYAVGNSTAKQERFTAHEIIGFMAVTLNSLFILGLKSLGWIMQDPYGADPEDLSVLHYVTEALTSSAQMLKTKTIVLDDEKYEAENVERRPSLGGAYD